MMWCAVLCCAVLWCDVIWYDIWCDVIYDMIYDITYDMIYDTIHDMMGWDGMGWDGMGWDDMMWCDVIWYSVHAISYNRKAHFPLILTCIGCVTASMRKSEIAMFAISKLVVDDFLTYTNTLSITIALPSTTADIWFERFGIYVVSTIKVQFK